MNIVALLSNAETGWSMNIKVTWSVERKDNFYVVTINNTCVVCASMVKVRSLLMGVKII
jgi:NAD-dependent dihydropyrimidine dehydrogenase PreA subunit